MPYYAVALGRKVGIYDTYDECKLQVLNYPNAIFKKFKTVQDAEAFIKEHSSANKENLVSRVNSYEGKSIPIVSEPPCKKIKTECETENKTECKLVNGLLTNEKGFVIVYTDGACSNNGKMGAKAGIGIWFSDDNPLNISAPVQGPPTNNNAEIQAARVAITQAGRVGVRKLTINTDSKFVINCITQWIHKWKKNNWQLSTGGHVKNKEELIKLDRAIQSLEVVEWIYVAGHRGIRGNEMADKLAKAGANKYKTNLTFSNDADTYYVSYHVCDETCRQMS